MAQAARSFEIMNKHKHGGARKGAGRKLGSGEGRKIISKSVAMKKEDWQRLDAARGTEARGRYLAKLLT
jgi:hypothetical protein